MERLRRRREEPNRPATVQPVPAPAPTPVEGAAVLPRTGVEVVFGPFAESMDLEGMTLEAAVALVRRGLNVPPELRPLLNGTEDPDPQQTLELGDHVEFVRSSGEKG